ncbi:hypothetical protein OY671_011837, partial [Metschnikowia pulcherrima]
AELGSRDIQRAWRDMSDVYGGAKDSREYILAIAKRDESRRRYNEISAVYPVIMSPISGQEPFRWGDDLKGADHFRNVSLPAQIPSSSSVALNYPSMSVPTGSRDGHVPQGVQSFAADFRADSCMQVAEDIEHHARMPFAFGD